jgi:tetratricopeptide (TPR) repeat protein
MHHRGTLDLAHLTALVNAFPTDVSQLNQLDRALQKDKNHFESLVAMGRELRSASFFEASNRYYGKAIKEDDAKKEPAKRESILLDMGLNFLELQEGKQASEIFERCLKEFPQSSNRPDFLLNLAQCYILNEQKTKARKSLETLIEGFPQSEASRKAQVLMKSL